MNRVDCTVCAIEGLPRGKFSDGALIIDTVGNNYLM